VVESIIIETMTRADVPRVMEIELQCFATPWHESAYITELSNRSAYYIAASLGDLIVGYGGLWIIADEAHITTLGVEPPFRGRKIGERILVAMLEEAAARGVRRITLEVRERNVAAQNLYRKYGFAAAAIRRGYYSDNNENAVVMWVSNIHTAEYRAKFLGLKNRLPDETESSKAPAQADPH